MTPDQPTASATHNHSTASLSTAELFDSSITSPIVYFIMSLRITLKVDQSLSNDTARTNKVYISPSNLSKIPLTRKTGQNQRFPFFIAIPNRT
jgi:hypothetical protein